MVRVDLKEAEIKRDYSGKQIPQRTPDDEFLDDMINSGMSSSVDVERAVKKGGLVSKLIGRANSLRGGVVYGSIGGIITGLYITLNSSYHGGENAIWGMALLFPYLGASKRAKAGAIVAFVSSAMLVPLASEIWRYFS